MREPINKIENKNSEKEYNILLDLYVNLIEKREEALFKKQPYLESKYILYFYTLMKEEIKSAINVKKLRNKIGIFLSNDKKNYDIHISDSDEITKKEIEILLEQTIKINNMVEMAKDYMKTNDSNKNNQKEIKSIFKLLTKRLHPDFNINTTDNKDKLWDRTRKAYDKNDLETLRILSNVLEHDVKRTKVYSLEELKQKIHQLCDEIKHIETGFPFDIEKKLEDKDWIEECKLDIKNRIKKLKDEENHLINKLNSLIQE